MAAVDGRRNGPRRELAAARRSRWRVGPGFDLTVGLEHEAIEAVGAEPGVVEPVIGDERATARRVVGQAAYLPRALSADRMRDLYGATDRMSLIRARAGHVSRGLVARRRRADE